jgi:hypothetical protein
LIKAITDSTGRSGGQVKADLKKEGDLGLVAMVGTQPATLSLSERFYQNSKNSQKVLFKPKPLTLDFVFKNLKEIALSTGHSVSLPRRQEGAILTVITPRHRRKRRQSLPNSSLHARELRRNTSFGVWRANFGSATPRSPFWYLLPMPLSWQRKKRVSQAKNLHVPVSLKIC